MGRLRGIDPPFSRHWKKILILDPPFSRCLRKISILDPPFFRILRKKVNFRPLFSPSPDIDFRPPFFGTIDFRVSGPQVAYLSPSLKECPPPGDPHIWKDGLFIETGPDDECSHGISSSYVRQTVFNSLAPGRCGNKFKSVAPKQMVRIKFLGTCEIALGECSRIPLMKSHHWFR